ncbi:MAG: putative metal-binding motif-containing protein [Deltaproteobacteria bacterium]|nr:putative metal-binding motif-containing protein [Deltaproteobacteria bacterium]MCB9788167.1 putative metal-binding motif-containing protein [Deltaproteobacteria bacterium]
METLHLQISSDAPAGGQGLQELRLLFIEDTGDALKRFPQDAADPAFTRTVTADFDPVAAPVLMQIQYGTVTFTDSTVRVQVTGRIDGHVATIYEGTVDLLEAAIVKVHLSVLDPACDADGDGFVDCGIEGCCAGPTPLADCEPNVATANPWGTERPCDDCDDGIDQDCQGGDSHCADEDNDGVFDCKEARAECGVGDPAVGPGLAERCDGKDNDCDGHTDEDFTFAEDAKAVALGEPCGKGECAGGVVECKDELEAQCSTFPADAVEEICTDGKDNDCDGATDEGCSAQADLDGDGFTKLAGDCNDMDSGVFPGAPEKCCPAVLKGSPEAVTRCDKDCSGSVETAQFCADNDLDGDGYSSLNDCDDTNPFVYPGAPEKCGDGVDQDCFADDLPCDGVEDADGDHWSPPADCNDEDPGTNPESVELCDRIDNDCDGLTDEGNPETEQSGPCGSDVGECELGTRVCVAVTGPGYEPGDVVCIGDVTAADEVCNGLDDDCDGMTDEGFGWQGMPVDASCDGVGSCGQGVVECLPDTTGATCSTNPDGSAAQTVVETCNGEDDDCDGTTDEALTDYAASTCLTAGVCGTKSGGAFVAKAVCRVNPTGAVLPGWDCDYTPVATFEQGTEKTCDGLDNDCDGGTDDEFEIGKGCDGTDADECKNGTRVCDPADATTWTCDESDATNAKEVCDGEDNDCDGATDEDFSPGTAATNAELAYDGGPNPGDVGLFLGEGCGTGLCVDGSVVCDPFDPKRLTCTSLDKIALELCDGVDQDCDGATDDGFDVGVSCGIGACAGGVKECAPGGLATRCDSMPSGDSQTTTGSKHKDSSEICDNIDNDCDAATDEALTATKPAELLAAGCDPDGACGEPGQTSATCAAGQWTCTYNSPHYDEGGDELGLCDSLDNDCDGTTDDAYAAGGQVTWLEPDGVTARVVGETCGFGACAGGTTQCDATTLDALVCSSSDQAGPETCDGEDEDCDDAIDEGLTSIVDAGCDTDGACGESGQTTALCTLGDWTCTFGSPNYQEGDELGRCDGVDNDCDASTDEDFGSGGSVSYTEPDGETRRSLGQPCGLGECSGGMTVCADGGAALRCTSVTLPLPVDECSGLDEDCDGLTDERFKAGGEVSFDGGPFGADADKTLGQGCGTGRCAGGEVVCDGAAALTCDRLSEAVAETCNGADDDCDGKTDEDFKSGGSVTYDGGPLAGDANKVLDDACGAGSCEAGHVMCDPTDATKLTCSTLDQAGDDVCDEADNDCDGKTDEDFGALGSIGLATAPFADDLGKHKQAACGTGACMGGVVICDVSDPMALVCSSSGNVGPELCDGADNDCDGQSDEDYLDGTVVYDGGPYAADAGASKGEPCGTGQCAEGTVVCDVTDATKTSLTCSKHGVAESCNAKDDDCDGGTDEDYEVGGSKPWVENFPPNASRFLGESCGTGKCADGTVVCDGVTHEAVCSSNGQASVVDATCDDIDEDCNGVTDDFFGPTGTIKYTDWDNGKRYKGQSCGTGTCAGEVVCLNNNALTCDGVAPASDANCDGIDQSCDGETDEDYVPTPTTCGAGSSCASTGEMACVGGNVEDTCVEDSAAAQPADSTCDDFDDDCDGDTDEDYIELPTTCGTGACASTGAQVCATGGSVEDTCTPGVAAVDDATCDGIDDDCDDATDEDYVAVKCDTSPGGDGCATGTTSCLLGVAACVGDVACADPTPGCEVSGSDADVDHCKCLEGPPDTCPMAQHCVAGVCE